MRLLLFFYLSSFLSSVTLSSFSKSIPETDFLNSRIIFPMASPNSGSLFGPKISNAPSIRTMSPGAPISLKIPFFSNSSFFYKYICRQGYSLHTAGLRELPLLNHL